MPPAASPSDLPEKAFALEELLRNITSSLATASELLREDFTTGAHRNSPYLWQIPRMSCTVKLTLSYTKEGVRGVFSRTRTKEETEVVSTLALELVTAPRPAS
jgi:hypothetical protein